MWLLRQCYFELNFVSFTFFAELQVVETCIKDFGSNASKMARDPQWKHTLKVRQIQRFMKLGVEKLKAEVESTPFSKCKFSVKSFGLLETTIRKKPRKPVAHNTGSRWEKVDQRLHAEYCQRRDDCVPRDDATLSRLALE